MSFFIDDWIDELVTKIKNEYGDNRGGGLSLILR